MEHDTPLYDDRPRKGRKRRVWMCENEEGGVAYLSHTDFLEHDEDYVYYYYGALNEGNDCQGVPRDTPILAIP